MAASVTLSGAWQESFVPDVFEPPQVAGWRTMKAFEIAAVAIAAGVLGACETGFNSPKFDLDSHSYVWVSDTNPAFSLATHVRRTTSFMRLMRNYSGNASTQSQALILWVLMEKKWSYRNPRIYFECYLLGIL